MNIRSTIKRVIENTDTSAGRYFDWVIFVLIVYSIITLTIETLPNLGGSVLMFLWYSEIVITVLFTLEYCLRVYTASKKKDYIFGFWGIIDFIAIAPFYITLLFGMAGIDLRGVRAFRLLRILRLLKIARYNRAVMRFHRAFQIAREEMILYVFLTIILLFISGTGIYYFENPVQPETFKSIFHSLWWALATLTTVGYGDVVPVTLGGRIFTFFVLMFGLGVVAVPAGLIASALSQARQEELESKQAKQD